MNREKRIYKLNSFDHAIAGATAGFITRFLCQPLDVLKIRFQLQVSHGDNAKYKSLIQSVCVMVKEEGLQALWKGHIPAQYLSIVFGAAQFSCYKGIVNRVTVGSLRSTSVEYVVHFGSGAVAGVFGTITSYPLDVIRTRLVVQGEPKFYHGVVDTTRKVYKAQGLRGFFQGLVPALIQVAPMGGLTFAWQNLFKRLWLYTCGDIVTFQDSMDGQSLSTGANLITGMLSGIVSKTFVYPFDVVKKRLQVQGFNEGKMAVHVVLKCSGLSECFRLTYKHEGFRGLFKGFYPSIIKAGATTALYFATFEYGCQVLGRYHESSS